MAGELAACAIRMAEFRRKPNKRSFERIEHPIKREGRVTKWP
jgi:hypothetical protein